MIRISNLLLTAIASICLTTAAHAHKNLPDAALETLDSAISMIDEGKQDVAIEILKELYSMYPDSYTIPYELALAQMWSNQYDDAIATATPLKTHPDCMSEVFSLIGSAYDEMGDPENAIAVFDEGIRRFPGSGLLWAEKGIVHLRAGNVASALENFEQGIDIEPNYAANYYHAAKIYAGSNMSVIGLMYAEAHIFLSDRPDRDREMSGLICRIYDDRVTFNGDTVNVKLFSDSSSKEIEPMHFYELGVTFGVAAEQERSIECLKGIRKSALNIALTSDKPLDRLYVIDYQKQVLDAGHWDAYNAYVLKGAFPDEYEKWLDSETNEAAFQAFADWFDEHPFFIPEGHSVWP